MTTRGMLLFGRFAYPPNALGYCGPDQPDALLDQVSARVVDGALRSTARGFEGAWPYLELIAHCSGLADPLDSRVVEAYWVGNRLLDRVSLHAVADSFEERFRDRVGRNWEHLVAGLVAGGRPHHNFHVFGVYPWLGLIRAGHDAGEPLRILDRCRIRWGLVTGIDGDDATVMSRPLAWTGTALTLGGSRTEVVTYRRDGHGLADDLVPGDWCALHWDWVCERLTVQRTRALVEETRRALDVVNRAPRPAPAAVLT
jgi:hypothetical protein